MRDVGVQGGDIMVTSRILEGRGLGKEQRMVRIWFESLMGEGRDSIIGWRWESTKAEIRSVRE